MSISIVTGANRGIGLEIAKALLKSNHYAKTVLAVRSEKNYDATVKTLGGDSSKLAFLPLDLEQEDTIKTFPDKFKSLFPGKTCDLLINNAGFAFSHDATEPVAVQAAKTVGINFTGTMNFTEAMIPLMTPGEGDKKSRIVIVSSMAGYLSMMPSEQNRELLSSPSLTIDQLTSFMGSYLAATRKATELGNDTPITDGGYRDTTYGMSKTAITTYTRVRGPQLTGSTLNACCPGYCVTDMTHHEGDHSAEEGANRVLFLANAPELANVTGKFFSNYKQTEY